MNENRNMQLSDHELEGVAGGVTETKINVIPVTNVTSYAKCACGWTGDPVSKMIYENVYALVCPMCGKTV